MIASSARAIGRKDAAAACFRPKEPGIDLRRTKRIHSKYQVNIDITINVFCVISTVVLQIYYRE
jgi:hypothetical protein